MILGSIESTGIGLDWRQGRGRSSVIHRRGLNFAQGQWGAEMGNDLICILESSICYKSNCKAARQESKWEMTMAKTRDISMWLYIGLPQEQTVRESVGQVSTLSYPRNAGIGLRLPLGWGVNFPAFWPAPDSTSKNSPGQRKLPSRESQALATESQLSMWEEWVPRR